jgi:hypothetical protein
VARWLGSTRHIYWAHGRALPASLPPPARPRALADPPPAASHELAPLRRRSIRAPPIPIMQLAPLHRRSIRAPSMPLMQLAPLRRRSIRAAVARSALSWLDPGAANAALRRPPLDSGEAFDANQKWLSTSGRFQRTRSTSFLRHIPRIWISSSPLVL